MAAYTKQWSNFLKDIAEVCNRHAAILENATPIPISSDGQVEAVAPPVEKGIKKRGKKEKKDPNAPKNPPSAYLIFANEQRPLLVKETPDIKMKDVMVELGQRWRNLSEAKKQKYQDLSVVNRKEYETQVKEYKQQLEDENSGTNTIASSEGASTPIASKTKSAAKNKKQNTPSTQESVSDEESDVVPEPKVAKKNKKGVASNKKNQAAAEDVEPKGSKKKKGDTSTSAAVEEDMPKKRKKRKGGAE